MYKYDHKVAGHAHMGRQWWKSERGGQNAAKFLKRIAVRAVRYDKKMQIQRALLER